MRTDVAEFEVIWRRFEENIHAKIISKRKTQELGLSMVNVALKEAIVDWFEPYSINGCWLSKLNKEDVKKGEEITLILKNHIKFQDIKSNKPISKLVTYGVPIVASLASCTVANILGGSIMKQIVSLAVPSAVLFPIMNISEKNLNEKAEKEKINGYLKQLEDYKKNIIKILQV